MRSDGVTSSTTLWDLMAMPRGDDTARGELVSLRDCVNDIPRQPREGGERGERERERDVLDAIDVITQPLCNLFYFVYDNGVYPVAWSNCIVVPVPKKSDTTEAGNYRGIAITSNLGKIFSIVLNSRLLKWAENTNILCDNQFGFRKNRSTVDCIFYPSSYYFTDTVK
jgi:hypothetical protein